MSRGRSWGPSPWALFAAGVRRGRRLRSAGSGGTSWAAPAVALLAIVTWFVDTIVPAFGLPDIVHQLALSAHYGLPMLGQWDVAGLAASAVLLVGGVLIGAWAFGRRDLRG